MYSLRMPVYLPYFLGHDLKERSYFSFLLSGHLGIAHGKLRQPNKDKPFHQTKSVPFIRSSLFISLTSTTWSAAATSPKLQSKSLARISPTREIKLKFDNDCIFVFLRLLCLRSWKCVSKHLEIAVKRVPTHGTRSIDGIFK